MREGRQRNHLPSGGRTQVDILEPVGAPLELRIDLHHHKILVHGLVHRGDLPLAKSVVERAVDAVCRDAQAAGGIAIDHQARLESVVLQVRVHIQESGDGSSCPAKLAAPNRATP